MRRKDLDDKYPHESEGSLNPGDYCRTSLEDRWIMMAPNGDLGCLSPKVHKITEHEDGTITVSPSIQFHTGKKWHGFLEQGIWREC